MEKVCPEGPWKDPIRNRGKVRRGSSDREELTRTDHNPQPPPLHGSGQNEEVEESGMKDKVQPGKKERSGVGADRWFQFCICVSSYYSIFNWQKIN